MAKITLMAKYSLMEIKKLISKTMLMAKMSDDSDSDVPTLHFYVRTLLRRVGTWCPHATPGSTRKSKVQTSISR